MSALSDGPLDMAEALRLVIDLAKGGLSELYAPDVSREEEAIRMVQELAYTL